MLPPSVMVLFKTYKGLLKPLCAWVGACVNWCVLRDGVNIDVFYWLVNVDVFYGVENVDVGY